MTKMQRLAFDTAAIVCGMALALVWVLRPLIRVAWRLAREEQGRQGAALIHDPRTGLVVYGRPEDWRRTVERPLRYERGTGWTE